MICVANTKVKMPVSKHEGTLLFNAGKPPVHGTGIEKTIHYLASLTFLSASLT